MSLTGQAPVYTDQVIQLIPISSRDYPDLHDVRQFEDALILEDSVA